MPAMWGNGARGPARLSVCPHPRTRVLDGLREGRHNDALEMP